VLNHSDATSDVPETGERAMVGGMSETSLLSRIEMDARLLRSGAALVSVGLLLATAGSALIGIATAKAARSWVRQLDRSPGATAAATYHQAKSASAAGWEAWRAARQEAGAASAR
jgi:hypothetical protein